MKKKPNKIKQKDWDSVDSPPLSDDLLKKMSHVKEVHPDRPARIRGRQKLPVKIPVSIRLNPDIIKFFKSGGKGWQSEINSILNDYVKKHNVA